MPYVRQVDRMMCADSTVKRVFSFGVLMVSLGALRTCLPLALHVTLVYIREMNLVGVEEIERKSTTLHCVQDENTPLHLAAKKNKVKVVRLLLDQGAYTEAANQVGAAGLDKASREELCLTSRLQASTVALYY